MIATYTVKGHIYIINIIFNNFGFCQEVILFELIFNMNIKIIYRSRIIIIF